MELGFLIAVASLVQSTGARVHRLQKLRLTGLTAPAHVESSPTRD